MSRRYPDPGEAASVLAEVARRAVAEHNVTHPEDVANVMTAAIEAAAVTLVVLAEREGP